MAKNINAWKDATKDSNFLHGLVISDKNSTIKSNSSLNYLGMVRRLFQQVHACYPDMIEHSEGVALLHTGKASGVLKLGQPIDETKMLNIFVLLRRDPCFTKPKSKRAAKVQVAKKKEATIKMQTENEDYSCDDSDSGDMSGEDTFEFNSNKVNPTMVAQTFQNYVSALKWWVKYENSEYSKEPGV